MLMENTSSSQHMQFCLNQYLVQHENYLQQTIPISPIMSKNLQSLVFKTESLSTTRTDVFIDLSKAFDDV